MISEGSNCFFRWFCFSKKLCIRLYLRFPIYLQLTFPEYWYRQIKLISTAFLSLHLKIVTILVVFNESRKVPVVNDEFMRRRRTWLIQGNTIILSLIQGNNFYKSDTITLSPMRVLSGSGYYYCIIISDTSLPVTGKSVRILHDFSVIIFGLMR